MKRLGHKPSPTNRSSRYRHHCRVSFVAGEGREVHLLETSVNECPVLFLREAAGRLLELTGDVEEATVRARVVEAATR